MLLLVLRMLLLLLVVMRSVCFDENIMLYSMQSFHSDYSKILPRGITFKNAVVLVVIRKRYYFNIRVSEPFANVVLHL